MRIYNGYTDSRRGGGGGDDLSPHRLPLRPPTLGRAAQPARQSRRARAGAPASAAAAGVTTGASAMAAAATRRPRGRPEKIDDLNNHKLLHYSNQSSGNVWKLTAPSGEKRQVRTAGWLSVNDGQSLLNAAISGLGIAYLPSFLYADAMEKGLIEDAIPDLPVETQGIYAVYPPGRFTQPKVRAFIDFLVHAFAEKGPSDW